MEEYIKPVTHNFFAFFVAENKTAKLSTKCEEQTMELS